MGTRPEASLTESEVLALVSSCSNTGRWGPDDELGTLNLITPARRRRAAALVREGVTVSLGKDIDVRQSAVNPRPAWHVMHHESDRPYASADSIHLQVHGYASTHVDALSHMFLDGIGYNGRRQADVVGNDGVRASGVRVMRSGIVGRGVLLDVAAAAGLPWLQPGSFIGPDLLDAAEARAGVTVGAGDVVIVHTGLEAREAVQGPEDPEDRAGLDAACLPWLWERDVAVYSGDCIEAIPQPYLRIPMPLHQIGLAVMGLVLVDCPTLVELVAACRRFGRHDVLFIAAPLSLPGGTGSPVNPIAVF